MYKYLPLGDSAILIKVDTIISAKIHRQVSALVAGIEKSSIVGIHELVPAYNELTVFYDPLLLNFRSLTDQIKHIENKLDVINLPNSKLIHIPVCYDSEFAPDLGIVAQKNNLAVNEVIKIHSSVEYLVYMLGFTPGFCYLGGMNSKISTSRKDSPRQIIEAGSVGIAGNQTGIYPIDSPGGWQIIGKTPLKLFDPGRTPEFLVGAGDYIIFDQITMAEFDEIKAMVSKEKYILRREGRDG